jgi:hypothetical protein
MVLALNGDLALAARLSACCGALARSHSSRQAALLPSGLWALPGMPACVCRARLGPTAATWHRYNVPAADMELPCTRLAPVMLTYTSAGGDPVARHHLGMFDKWDARLVP